MHLRVAFLFFRVVGRYVLDVALYSAVWHIVQVPLDLVSKHISGAYYRVVKKSKNS